MPQFQIPQFLIFANIRWRNNVNEIRTVLEDTELELDGG